MNDVKIAAIVLGCWLFGAFLTCGVWVWLKRWDRARRVDDFDVHVNHPSVGLKTRRLCPPPRGPEDDPDFMRTLR